MPDRGACLTPQKRKLAFPPASSRRSTVSSLPLRGPRSGSLKPPSDSALILISVSCVIVDEEGKENSEGTSPVIISTLRSPECLRGYVL